MTDILDEDLLNADPPQKAGADPFVSLPAVTPEFARLSVKASREGLLARGTQPISLFTGQKVTFEKGWGETKGMPRFDPGMTNTGVLTDAVRAVDCDIDDPEAAAKAYKIIVEALGPSTYLRTRSNSARFLLLYPGQGRKRIFETAAGNVEILGQGNQFLCYGTHPSGVSVYWLHDDPGHGWRREFTPDDIANGRPCPSGKVVPKTVADAVAPITDTDLDRLEAALIAQFGSAKPARPEAQEPKEPPAGDREREPSDSDADRRYGLAALDYEVRDLSRATEGSRNRALNRAAFCLGRYIAGGLLNRGEVERGLEDACRSNKLVTDKEGRGLRGVRRTIKSGLDAGIRHPRGRPACADVYDEDDVLVEEHLAHFADETFSRKPYPIDALGPALVRAARAIIEYAQCPAEIAANSLLGTTSLATQALANVETPVGQVRPISLFLLTIAESGDRKSTADRLAMYPIRTYEAQLLEEKRRLLEQYSARVRAWRAKCDHIERNKKLTMEEMTEAIKALGPEPIPPLDAKLTIDEGTIEGIMRRMSNMRGSTGVFSAEGGQFLGGYGFTDERKGATISAFAKLWDGDDLVIQRASETREVRGRRLACHLMTQPVIAATTLADSTLQGQGFLARYLMAAPESLAGTRFFKEPDEAAKQELQEYTDTILSLLNKPVNAANREGNELAPPTLRMSAEARTAWIEFFDDMERGQRVGGRYVRFRAAAGKAAEQAARIAGGMCLFENADEIDPSVERLPEIDGDAMLRACVLARWYLNEALRIISASGTPQENLDAMALLDWLREQKITRFTSSRIMQYAPNHMRGKEKIERMADELVAAGHLVREDGKRRAWKVVLAGPETC